MASYSRRSRSAGSHASTAGNRNGSAAAGPPNSSDWPSAASSCARCAVAKHGVDRREHAGAARLQAVERAGGGEAFQHAFVDGARIDAAGEVGNVLERLVVARGENAVDRLAADAAQRRERIVNGAALDVELDAGAVDRRRLDLDAEPLGLGAEFGELVGVAHVERHRGGEELDRIIRLHVGGLIGDQRIGRGVALVEAVIGEALQQFEDRLRLARLDAAGDRAGDETGALAPAFRCGFSCPWRGAAGRPRRANSRTGPAPPASPVPDRR